MTFMGLFDYEWWTIASAVAASVACGVLGCFLVLRRMSLLGDAISHAVLPGLAAAFLLTGSRGIFPMLAGAMVVGLLTTVLTAGLTRLGKVPEDASMGVVFTSLFALGVILISAAAREVDLDPMCVFYGQMELAAFDTWSIAGRSIPRSTVILTSVMLVDLSLIAIFYKELKIVAFDPALAATMGINAALVHYTLMAAVAGTTVASFESVGSVLVVAMLIAPGATAQLLTDRLSRLLLIAAIVAATSAIGGYLLSAAFNTTVAGMMSVVAGALFLLAALLGPRHGVLARAVTRLLLSLRICREDILGMLYRVEESGADASLSARDARRALDRPLLARAAIHRLARNRLITGAPDRLALTPAGRDAASRLIRSHRLWETYLTHELGLPLDHVHEPSHRVEHFITPTIEEVLSTSVDSATDPHGRDVPARPKAAPPGP